MTSQTQLLRVVIMAIPLATAVGCGGSAMRTSAPAASEASAESADVATAGGESMGRVQSNGVNFSLNATDADRDMPSEPSNQLIGFDAHTATVGDNADDDRALFERLQANLATRLRVVSIDGDMPSPPPVAQSTDEGTSETSELTEADCGEARRIRDDICVVSERICAIADRNPDREDVAEVCEDGSERCLRARSDVASTCGADSSEL